MPNTVTTVAPSDARLAHSTSDYHDQFAAAYDTLYSKRDVVSEVHRALMILALEEKFDCARILDFGCGTGSHALAMARRGLSVVGVDASKAMINQANAKVEALTKTRLQFAFTSSGQEWPASAAGPFDGVVSFFNVLNCMQSPQEMVRTLSMIQSRMTQGAMGYFEVWNGAAVFADAPRPDVRHFPLDAEGEREMIRITLPEVDHIEQRCTLRYRVLELDKRTGSYTEFDSIHNLQFLTPVQYRHVLSVAGLTILDEFPKLNPRSQVSAGDWYIAYLVTRK